MGSVATPGGRRGLFESPEKSIFVETVGIQVGERFTVFPREVHTTARIAHKDVVLIAQDPQVILPEAAERVLEVPLGVLLRAIGVVAKLQRLARRDRDCCWSELLATGTCRSVKARVVVAGFKGVRSATSVTRQSARLRRSRNVTWLALGYLRAKVRMNQG